MSETTAHTTTDSTTEEVIMLFKILYDMLLGKYPAKSGEKAAQYMERLLALRSKSKPESLLFVETEILMLFILLRTLRSAIKKAQNNNQDTKELQTDYEHNSSRLEDYIDKWSNLKINC